MFLGTRIYFRDIKLPQLRSYFPNKHRNFQRKSNEDRQKKFGKDTFAKDSKAKYLRGWIKS